MKILIPLSAALLEMMEMPNGFNVKIKDVLNTRAKTTLILLIMVTNFRARKFEMPRQTLHAQSINIEINCFTDYRVLYEMSCKIFI